MRGGWAASALIVAVLAAVWARQPTQPLSAFDQPFYLGIAHDLVQDGRFTDGFMFAEPGADGVRAPGMRFAPLYPALVAGASVLDPGLRRSMDCVVAASGREAGCPAEAASMRCLQFLALCAFYWLVWWLSGKVGGRTAAWLGLLVGLAAAPLLLGSVEMVMTEIACLLLSTGAIAAGVAALGARGRARRGWCAVSGVLLGLTVLTRPGFLYVLPAAALCLGIKGGRRGLAPAGMIALGTGAVLAPWLLRNWLVLGAVGLTRHYDSHTLVQRIAFDTMSWHEYAMAYVCWLPDGSGFGRALAGPHACDRFGWDDPASFYRLGLRDMLPDTLSAAGGYEHHLGYLLGHYVLRMKLKHLLVSLPLALRGAYVSHWWGLVLLPPTLAATVSAWRGRARFAAGPFLIMALPAWFMLAFNAAVAVNQVRYNLILVPAYAASGGLALAWAWRHATTQSLGRVV